MTTALVTGVTGQDGRYLAELLLAKGYRVTGTARHAPAEPLPPGIEVRLVDSRDVGAMSGLLSELQPAEVYHLAAESSVARSWDHPAGAERAAEAGAAGLLGAVEQRAPRARVVLAGSSEVFGAATESPQNEATPVRPATPYGRGKAAALAAGREARSRRGLHVGTAILYNHESPRRPPSFVSRKVTMAVAAIAGGRARELRLGNLESVRDWGFAGDYVEAMWEMLQADTPDDYVIGTGIARTVRELCETAFATVDLDYRDHVVSDAALFRPVDPAALVADASHARARLRWAPRTPFAEMIREMVDADVARLRRGEG